MKMTDKLDLLMNERGLNRREFSQQSGIPYMTIVNFYEKGTENVKLSTLKKIAAFFNVSLDYIADDAVAERSSPKDNISIDSDDDLISKNLTSQIANKILTARKKKNLTQKQVADALGLTEGQYAHYEKGRANPDINTIYQMCIFFDASFDEWLGLLKKAPVTAHPKTEAVLSATEVSNQYKSLDIYGKRTVCAVLREEVARVDHEKAAPSHLEFVRPPEDDDEIPAYEVLFGVAAAAEGSGAELDDFDGHITIAANDETRQADLVIKVEGRSMEPDYHDGEYVLVRLQPEVEIGEVGVWMIDGRGYIKERGRSRLISRNPDVPDVRINEQDCRCIGKVIGELDPEMILEQ